MFTDEWMDQLMEKWMDRPMDGWNNGWTLMTFQQILQFLQKNNSQTNGAMERRMDLPTNRDTVAGSKKACK